MYAKIREIDQINSEKEFEDYVRRKFRDRDVQEWLIGTERGKKILELMNRVGYSFSEGLILDLGSGFGGISLFLSKEAGEVIDVDINKDLLKVAHIRAKIARANSSAIIGSATNLPLKNDLFSLILLIGVLEWVPCSKSKADPYVIQLQVLRDIQRILRKQGKSILAIENRFFIKYWLGGKDHHSGLRFVPILPRKLADFICKALKGERYLNRTYSYFELRKILTKLGFKIQKICVGIPSYNVPSEIGDLNIKDDIKKKILSSEQRRSRRIVWNIIDKLGLMKFFCSNFIVVFQKSNDHK